VINLGAGGITRGELAIQAVELFKKVVDVSSTKRVQKALTPTVPRVGFERGARRRPVH
jgi:hypothetical protein